jgi:hypothetical protein
MKEEGGSTATAATEDEDEHEDEHEHEHEHDGRVGARPPLTNNESPLTARWNARPQFLRNCAWRGFGGSGGVMTKQTATADAAEF